MNVSMLHTVKNGQNAVGEPGQKSVEQEVSRAGKSGADNWV